MIILNFVEVNEEFLIGFISVSTSVLFQYAIALLGIE